MYLNVAGGSCDVHHHPVRPDQGQPQDQRQGVSRDGPGNLFRFHRGTWNVLELCPTMARPIGYIISQENPVLPLHAIFNTISQ